MNRAIYYRGLTFEFKALSQHSQLSLTCDGQLFSGQPDQPESEELKKNHNEDESYHPIIERIINKDENKEIKNAIKEREKIKEEHSELLYQGVIEWNAWRRDNSHIRPLLYDTDFRGRDFPGGNFANANLIKAKFQGKDTNLEKANFHEANLGGANFSYANLRGANFCRTDLYSTVLSGAQLDDANLQGTQMAMTKLKGANLNNCTVYGIAAWDLDKDSQTEEKNLLVTLGEGSEIRVDGLDAAQFVFLLLDNPKITNVINQAADKVVLILGRFKEPKHQEILEAIKGAVRLNNLVPIVFDFERPKDRDFSETVLTLAGLSKFIIADVTEPKSVPLELHALIPNFAIPFVPIILGEDPPFSMLQDLLVKHKPWVLSPLKYTSKSDLIEVFKEAVIEEAKKKRKTLQGMKSQSMQLRHTADYRL